MLGLPLNEDHTILSDIFSNLFSDFRAQGFRSIPTPTMTTLIEFFIADT